MRLDACTSISSILYEFSSSLILCASAGVNLLHVAGSLLRSYTDDGNVSYTDKFDANARRFAGAVCDLCVSVGGFELNIVESAGATEGAPAAGSAELIVDITTTGTTLAANGLKIIEDGVILRSQANLVAARKANWGAAARETARIVLDRRLLTVAC